jgi:hypothetical protein
LEFFLADVGIVINRYAVEEKAEAINIARGILRETHEGYHDTFIGDLDFNNDELRKLPTVDLDTIVAEHGSGGIVRIGNQAGAAYDLYPTVHIQNRNDLVRFLEQWRRHLIQTEDEINMRGDTMICGATTQQVLRALYPQVDIVGLTSTHVLRINTSRHPREAEMIEKLFQDLSKLSNRPPSEIYYDVNKLFQECRNWGSIDELRERVPAILKEPLDTPDATAANAEAFADTCSETLVQFMSSTASNRASILAAMESHGGHMVAEALLMTPHGKCEHLLIDANAEQHGVNRLVLCEWERAITEGAGMLTEKPMFESTDDYFKDVGARFRRDYKPNGFAHEPLAVAVAMRYNSAQSKE